MRTNVATKRPAEVTHEGGRAAHANPVEQLRRSVLSCLLWEDSFYEDGVDIAKRIADLTAKVPAEKAAELAVQARGLYKLRHAPLWLTLAMCRAGGQHRSLVGDTLSRVIQRPDELAEFMAMYWKDGKVPVASQVKKGLAAAFAKFNEYSLAKYNRDGAVKLRDVLFLSHADPRVAQKLIRKRGDMEFEKLGRAKTAKAIVRNKKKIRGEVYRHTSGMGGVFSRLVEGKLYTPDTWEVAISAAKGNKAESKAEWERLLGENKLFALALIRNIRNMREAGVHDSKIKEAIRKMDVSRVLPYRFITAARYNPHFEDVLEEAMFKAIAGMEKLPGTTALMVDVSGSMFGCPLSAKSDMERYDAAAGLAILCRELCEDVKIYSFSNRAAVVPNRRGFALRDAIKGSQPNSGTYLAGSLQEVASRNVFDRWIVITDEQTHDGIHNPPGSKGRYLINVAAYKNGVGYKTWTHLDGFSEGVFHWIGQIEKRDN